MEGWDDETIPIFQLSRRNLLAYKASVGKSSQKELIGENCQETAS